MEAACTSPNPGTTASTVACVGCSSIMPQAAIEQTKRQPLHVHAASHFQDSESFPSPARHPKDKKCISSESSACCRRSRPEMLILFLLGACVLGFGGAVANAMCFSKKKSLLDVRECSIPSEIQIRFCESSSHCVRLTASRLPTRVAGRSRLRPSSGSNVSGK